MRFLDFQMHVTLKARGYGNTKIVRYERYIVMVATETSLTINCRFSKFMKAIIARGKNICVVAMVLSLSCIRLYH